MTSASAQALRIVSANLEEEGLDADGSRARWERTVGAIGARSPDVSCVWEPLNGLEAAVATARAEAGRLLAAFRHAAGLSQAKLAVRIGYNPTAVAHAELARRPVSAEFWEIADDALGAGGKLTAQGIRIRDRAMAVREEMRRLDKAGHAWRLSRLLTQPGAGGAATTVLTATDPAITMTATSRCPDCHQPVTVTAQVAGLPETATPAPPSPARPAPAPGLTGARRTPS